jgi:hypothetical protein
VYFGKIPAIEGTLDERPLGLKMSNKNRPIEDWVNYA